MNSYDDALWAAADRHMSGPKWEGMGVTIPVERENWKGFDLVELEVETAALSVNGTIISITSYDYNGDNAEKIDIKRFSDEDLQIILEPDEQERAAVMADERYSEGDR